MALVTHEKLEIPTSLANLYQEMAVSPIMLLKNYALTHIYTMIQKYEVENTYFEKKYGCTFQEFKTKVESMENEENFEWEDDLMDWEFAVENLAVWKHKVEEVEN